VKEFLKYADKHKKEIKDENGEVIKSYHKVKPIIGCEVYVSRHYDHRIKDTAHRGYYHLILLAKNYDGYKNLMHIVSTGHIEGKYYDKPRVSHEVIEKYHNNLICCSACLAGEISRDILSGDMDAAREAIRWHKNLFGSDYYLEVQLHKTEVPGLSQEVYDNQKIVNSAIFDLAEEMDVKVVASNDVHFVKKEDGPAHDRLICLTTNALISDPNRMRYTQQEYLKSEEEMLELFPHHPEVVSNTLEVADKIEDYKIDRGHVLPKYELAPDFLAEIDFYLEKYKDIIDAGRCDKGGKYRGDEFCNSVAYLCYLTYEGARKRYGDTLNQEQFERIDFELKTVCKMGFPDYFLIVQDYINACRSMGSMVGPGRGSAAGSVVAYCLGITNLDPIKYQLLFERFLNPDRISMPDIDVDFENLPMAHKYVEDKYGLDHVSRVITFGTMAAKSAIKDVARISDLPLDESNRLAKMVPDRLSEKQEKEYLYNPKLDELKPGFKAYEKEVEVDDPDNPGQKIKQMKSFQKGMEDTDVKINLKNCYRLVPEFKEELEHGTDLCKEVLKYALALEGSIRQVGMHACATIIGRGNLTDYIPICLTEDKDNKGSQLWTSQYDGHYIEDVGMLKMDFLGLNTLSIIHECLDMIKKNHGVDIDIEAIPIDDKGTFELYGRGDTTSVFQFESEGMKNWLQKLHPERFEDLIAMNALYRPGPLDYIPDFVARKLGQQEIVYDLPQMEEFLKDTYGVTVYQEQVMLLSQKLANFTKGEADKLRKAMGKKQIAILNSLKDKFMTGGQKNGHPEKTLDKIWKDWEKFAQYAFNKSHATCYAWVSYQTAYLKCHYTSEFQAANLSCNIGKADEIKKIMEDCKKSHIRVLNPDVNESGLRFTVVKSGDIRFGLGGIKGFGENISLFIMADREKNGLYQDIYDFMERTSGMVNRKAFEALLYSGALDSFGIKRGLYQIPDKNGETFIDALLRFAEHSKRASQDTGLSLFGDVEEMKPVRPEIPQSSVDLDTVDMLHREKDLCGMYLSGHPLDRFAFEMNEFTTPDVNLAKLPQMVEACQEAKQELTLFIGGYVTESLPQTSQYGKTYLKAAIEDFEGRYDLNLNGKDYEAFEKYMKKGASVLIEGKIQEKYFVKKDGQAPKDIPYGFKIKRMVFMEDASETYLKNLKLLVDARYLTEETRKALLKLLKANKGKVPLSLTVFDSQTGYHAELNVRKFKVETSMQLIDGLKSLGIQVQTGNRAS